VTDQKLKRLQGYWSALRAGRPAPRRSEIDPRRIEPLLENAFILERTARDAARFRLAGAHFCTLMGMEIRGMPVNAIFVPGYRAACDRAVSAVFDEGAQVLLDLVAEEPGRMALSGRMLILPLASETGVLSRAMGGLVTAGIIGAPPRRFSIRGQQTLDPAAGAYPTLRDRPGFAEAAIPFRTRPLPALDGDGPSPAPPRGLPARLRLVENDD